MCMKYINANICCYKSITKASGNLVSLNAPFDTISVCDANNNNEKVIGSFYINTQINILGTSKLEKMNDNILYRRGTLEVVIRLTKCDKDENKRICCDLDSFEIDLSKNEDEILKACFEYFNYTRITNVKSLVLPGGTGDYVIKVLVKEASDKEFTIQSMSYFCVKE